jgi:hypothetical protein
MDGEKRYPCPAHWRVQEDCPVFRIIRVPPSLDKFFRPLQGHFHWDHVAYFRLLVLTMAFLCGRRHVANLYRYVDAEHHRTRVNNGFLIERWDPEATLRQKAQERLQTLHPRRGETIYLIIDDCKTAKRGKAMDAITKVNDPVTATYIQGQQSVCAILVCRDQVIPWGIRLYVKPQHAKALGRPFRKTTELAAQLIREFKAPRGVKVMALLAAYDRCHTVVQACREKHVRCAATLKGHRSLFKPGWKLKAGRYGRNLFRRRHTTSLVLTKPHGPIRYRPLEAGWLQVSSLGVLRVVFSRQGAARKILGLVTDDSELAAAELIQTDETRWAVEQFFKDCQQLLGLGQ